MQELQKYPDSLLSSIASSCSSSTSYSSSSAININLAEVPNWPCELVKPTEAAAVIPAMYRTGQLPLDWLQQQLAAPNSINNTIYNNLQQLLAFLHLPSRVLQWLPVKEMTMQHVLPLRFFHKAAAFRQLKTCSASDHC